MSESLGVHPKMRQQCWIVIALQRRSFRQSAELIDRLWFLRSSVAVDIVVLSEAFPDIVSVRMDDTYKVSVPLRKIKRPLGVVVTIPCPPTS